MGVSLACPKCLAEGKEPKDALAFRVYSQVPKPRGHGKKGYLATSVTLAAVFCGTAGLRDGKGTLAVRAGQHGLVPIEPAALRRAHTRTHPAKHAPKARPRTGKARKASSGVAPSPAPSEGSTGTDGASVNASEVALAGAPAVAGPSAPA